MKTPCQRVLGYNLIIMLLIAAATTLPRGSTDAQLWLAVVSVSLFVCIFLVNTGLAIFSDSAEARRAYWLSLLLVLLIGFGTCAIQFAA